MTKGKLHSVPRIRIFEQAVEQLKKAILEGHYQPGEKLPTEKELCESLGVSRSTIREAMRVLETEGFIIRARRGTGAYVAHRPQVLAIRGDVLRWLSQREESMGQIMQVRESIEWLTASLAARNPLDELIAKLEHLVDQQYSELKSSHGGPNIDKLAELDVEFHIAISEACGNDLAHEIVSHIVPAFSRANRAVLWAGEKVEPSIREHEAILKAIKDGDPDAAEAAMRVHIDRVWQEICAYLGEISDKEVGLAQV